MDHKISSITIARTPVSIKRFPKLCLRKKAISKNIDENKENETIQANCQNHTDVLNRSLSLSPIFKMNLLASPFVTKHRPAVRNIPMSRIITDTDSSSHNSNVSDGNNSDNKNSTSENVSKIDESVENINDIDKNANVEHTPVSNESSKAEVTPDTANLMDALYGNIWRSTPGLFKKTKSKTKHKKFNAENLNIDDNLINELNSLSIHTKTNEKSSTNSNCSIELIDKDEIRDNVSTKPDVNNVSVILDSSDDSDLLISKKKNTVKPLSSSDSEDSEPLKPSKLIFDTSYPDLNLENKENIDQRPAEKNIIQNIVKKNKPSTKSDTVKKYGFIASLGDNIPPELRDRKASYYRENFKSKKTELTSILFKMYNVNVFESQICPSLSIIWSSTLRKTAGRAHNKLMRIKEDGEKKTKRHSHIELSIKVLDTAQRLRDTLAHELCHVAVWLIDGQQRDGHGPYWKSWVNKVLRRYPEIGSLPRCHSLDIHFKYSYRCMKCGYKINRHSKSIDVSAKACGYCFGRFECVINKKLKDGMVVSTPVKERREATGFALYVKENYGMVRGGNTPHKETMKYLGREYAKMKLESKENCP